MKQTNMGTKRTNKTLVVELGTSSLGNDRGEPRGYLLTC